MIRFINRIFFIPIRSQPQWQALTEFEGLVSAGPGPIRNESGHGERSFLTFRSSFSPGFSKCFFCFLNSTYKATKQIRTSWKNSNDFWVHVYFFVYWWFRVAIPCWTYKEFVAQTFWTEESLIWKYNVYNIYTVLWFVTVVCQLLCAWLHLFLTQPCSHDGPSCFSQGSLPNSGSED